MKLLVAFVVGGLRRQTSTLKPFNPILGETFQADLAGTQVFVEQISHHPPISCWQVTRPDGKVGLGSSAGASAPPFTTLFCNSFVEDTHQEHCEAHASNYQL